MKRVAREMMGRTLLKVFAIGLTAGLFLYGCAGDEKSAKGKKLYNHYCSHCHGESGQQGEGFNWERMPDPRPKNLASNAEMSTFSDKEIFDTVYRDMRNWEDPEVLDDENYFAVPTMPTFKYTLSEEEIWGNRRPCSYPPWHVFDLRYGGPQKRIRRSLPSCQTGNGKCQSYL